MLVGVGKSEMISRGNSMRSWGSCQRQHGSFKRGNGYLSEMALKLSNEFVILMLWFSPSLPIPLICFITLLSLSVHYVVELLIVTYFSAPFHKSDLCDDVVRPVFHICFAYKRHLYYGYQTSPNRAKTFVLDTLYKYTPATSSTWAWRAEM